MQRGRLRGTLWGAAAAASASPCSAEGAQTGTGVHAAHRVAEGPKERHLHSTSLGALHPWATALHSDALEWGPEAWQPCLRPRTWARRRDDTVSGLRRRHLTHSWIPTPAEVLIWPHSWGPRVTAGSSLRGPPPKPPWVSGDCWVAWPGGGGPAAALSRSRKDPGPGAAGCPVGVFLAPPELPLQSSRPPLGHCPPRGLVPPATPPCLCPMAEAARATCCVWGSAGQRRCAPTSASRGPGLASLNLLPGRVHKPRSTPLPRPRHDASPDASAVSLPRGARSRRAPPAPPGGGVHQPDPAPCPA